MKCKLSRESAVAVSRCVLFHHSFPSRASQKEATACPVTMAEDLLESLRVTAFAVKRVVPR